MIDECVVLKVLVCITHKGGFMAFPTLFKEKNFLLLYFGRLVSDLGNVFYNFAIAWYLISITSSTGAAGFYMAFGAIVYFILTPFAGVLADRWNRVKIVYVTDFIRGAAILLTGLAIGLNHTLTLSIGDYAFSIDWGAPATKMVILYINAFIFSVNGALFAPAISSLMPYIVRQDQLQQGNSLFSAMGAFLSIIGSVLGALLYSLLGVAWIFIITGISYILSSISETFITTHTKPHVTTELTIKSTFVDLKTGFVFLFKNKSLMMFAIVGIIVNFFASPLYSLGAPYLYKTLLAVEPFYFSTIGIVGSIGSIAMSIFLSTRTQKDKVYPFLRTGITSWVPILFIQSLLIYLVINNHIGFFVFFGVSLVIATIEGMISVYINTPIGVAFQKYVPKEMLGRVNSMLSTIISGLVPIAVALAGIFLEYRTLPELYVLAGLGFSVATIIIWKSKAIQEF